jgi:tetratricopeptide (TPR) repeat protein
LSEAIEFASKIQNQFIDAAEYLFWRGKLYFLNGNVDLGKKFMREALNKDPDNVSF